MNYAIANYVRNHDFKNLTVVKNFAITLLYFYLDPLLYLLKLCKQNPNMKTIIASLAKLFV